MKKSEIPLRKVIAYKPNYASPMPVAVLETESLWQLWERTSREIGFGRSTDKRFSDTRSWGSGTLTGYLCIGVSNSVRFHETDREAAIAALREVLAEMPETLTEGYVAELRKSLPENLEVELLNNRYFEGPTWEAVEIAHKQARYAAQRKREAEQKEAELNRQWFAWIEDAIKARGLKTTYLRQERSAFAQIDLDTLGAILGIKKPEGDKS